MGNIDVQANTDKDSKDIQDSRHGVANSHTLVHIMDTEDDQDLYPDAEDGDDRPHGHVVEWNRLASTQNSEPSPPKKVNKCFRYDMDDNDEPSAPEQAVKSFIFIWMTITSLLPLNRLSNPSILMWKMMTGLPLNMLSNPSIFIWMITASLPSLNRLSNSSMFILLTTTICLPRVRIMNIPTRTISTLRAVTKICKMQEGRNL